MKTKTNLLKSIFISLLLVLGVSNAWAADVTKNAIIYFDNSAAQWNYSYHYFTINDDYGWKMTKVNNTQLYVHKRTDNTWGGYDKVRLFATNGDWGDAKSLCGGENNMKSYGANLTTTVTNYGFGAECYSLKPDKKGSTSSYANLSANWLGKDYTALNKTITIKAKVSTDGGTSYEEATSPGTLSATSFEFTAYNSCASGTTLSSGKITCGYTADTKLTAADATGYKFIGWYNSSGTQQTTEKTLSINPTADATYYAYYKANQYTITYKDQGDVEFTGSHENGYPTKHTYGIATTLKTASKTGYTFEGWYKEAACTNKITSLGATAYTANITLYAKWTANQYTITYKDQGGSNFSGTHESGYPTTHTYGTETTLKTASKTGYTFEGWHKESACTNKVTSLGATAYTANITLYAKWKPKTYAITLNANGGASNGSATATYNSNSVTNATYPTRDHYECTGYYTATSGGTLVLNTDGTLAKNVSGYTDANGNWIKDDAATLHARWTINQYTITYLVNSGTGTGTIAINHGTATQSGTLTANYNTSHTLTATPAKNYRVAGWYDKSDQLLQGGAEAEEVATYTITSLASDMTVKVVFAEANEVPSEVVVSSTIGGTVSPTGTATVLNRTPSTFTATPNPGYRFDHWSYDGGVEFVSENNTNEQGSITITATDAGTLTAHFVRVYTVKYYATPAAAGSVTAKVGETTINSGDALDVDTRITFTATTANNECNFIKWVNGAGEELSTDLSYIHTVSQDITIKAIFSINQYTLTFSAGEGGHVSATANNSAIASPASLDYNTSVTLTATPNANCMFLGWFDGNTQKYPSAVYTTKLTADMNLEAHFQKGTTIFFKPVDYWKADKARLAVYMWNSAGNKWIEFEDYGCNEDIFTADIPAGYTGFKIVRLKPASADGYDSKGDGLNWENKWNETENLTPPDGDKNLYDMNNKTITKLYFTPHANWTQANARFAACFMDKNKGNHTWVSMSSSDNIYNCAIPNGTWKYVIFCRMNPSAAANNWDNKWNQTTDLELPTNGQNHYTLNGGEWDGVTGEWHTAWDDSRWTTYSAPSYKITIQSTKNGTITVTKDGNAVTNGATLNLGDEIKITFTPADGNELSNYLINYASETETDGVYTVCGPTKIIAEFDPIAPSRTVYLRPNEDWLRDNPIMAARVWKSSGGDDRWYVMNTTDDDYTGAYSCKIPSEYDKIIFVRLNPNGDDETNDGFNWANTWNQTKGLTIIDKDNDATNDKEMRFAIGDKIVGGDDNDRYDGKWEENTPIWGLIANFNDWKAEGTIFMGYPGKPNVQPPYGTQHAFKLYNFIYAEGKYFGNAGTMKSENSGQWWTMDVNEQANCQMKLDAKGDYIYQLRFLTVGPELRKQISVTYPDATNVYTLLYEYTIDEITKTRMSYEIPAVAGEKLDTVSFHVLKDASPQITLLKNSIVQGEPISISVESDSVYNFVLQQTDGQAQILNAANPEVYTGNYYIRTDAAAGGWNAYKQTGNKMTYSSYADRSQNFNHYFCKWICNHSDDEHKDFHAYTNVKFCVANEYSHAISDELNGDEFIDKQGIAVGCLPEDGNVRFAWDSQTNELSRAYISGSAKASDRFLVLEGNEHLKAVDGSALNVSGLNPNEAIFADRQNWIYQLDVQANPYTDISLTAKFNDKVQTFFGTAKGVMQATNENYHKVRMIYDFKTNNLVAAWLLDQNQTIEEETLASNILIIRENQGSANQITFNNNNNRTDIQTAYGVMTFTQGHIQNNDLSQRERSLYWISFPFNVKIDDVFGLGIGEYADQWIIQRYNGAARAEKGLFSDSGTYWEYIFDRNTVLNAGEGYVLVLDLNKINFLYGANDVSLYFPSLNNVNTLSGTLPTEFSVPEHWCKIDREWKEGEKTYNHKYTDSHWNLIGVPALIDQTWSEEKVKQYHFMQDDLSFYYNFNLANSKYTVQSTATTFKAMYAYMVQFAGKIDWSTQAVTAATAPAELAARHNSDSQPEKVVLHLELAQSEEVADQTFIQLQQEGATADFDLSLDLSKIINAGSNIYTIVGEDRTPAAGNVLPFEETTVAVGVDIATAGEYTFRMPDGTEGMVVELIDYETNTTTNLLLDDYTVNLPAGSNEIRFALSLKPEKTATSIESTTTPSDSNIRKFIIDGKLYLQKDGMLYDAQGHIVR